MCRNIKPLFNYDPPVTDEEIHASSLQYVRKISGFKKPSKLNKSTFESAVNNISKITKELVDSLKTDFPPRNRENEIEKARAKAEKRFRNSN
jgi:hypothetical protein